jgi:hypothetical protein
MWSHPVTGFEHCSRDGGLAGIDIVHQGGGADDATDKDHGGDQENDKLEAAKESRIERHRLFVTERFRGGDAGGISRRVQRSDETGQESETRNPDTISPVVLEWHIAECVNLFV